MIGPDAILTSPIVAAGFQVVIGGVPASRALKDLVSDKAIADLDDGRLANVIEDAHRFYDDQFASGGAQAATVYPMLAARCAEARMKAIGELRRGFGEQETAVLTQRFSDWIGFTSRCVLLEAMAYLMMPDLGLAFQTFIKAEMLARALPDMNRPRLREMVWAMYGRIQAAAHAGQDSAAASDQAELSEMIKTDPSLKTYIDRLNARFDGIWKERQRLEEAKAAIDSAEPLLIGRLNFYLAEVEAGRLRLSDAETKVAAEDAVRRMTLGEFEIAIQVQERLARHEARRAVITTTLARAALMASPIASDRWLQALSLRALGYALLSQALTRRTDLDLFSQAKKHLDAALPLFDEEDGRQEAAQTVLWLAMAERGMGDFGQAMQRNRDAIRRVSALPESPQQQEALGVAFGNLADVEENSGQPAAALEDHYRAYRIFLQSKASSNAKQALLYFSRLAFQLGRSDEVVTAAQETFEVLLDIADLPDTVRTYLSLIASGFRLGRRHEVIELLNKAEQLLKPRLTEAKQDKETLHLMMQIKLWQGIVTLSVIGKVPGSDLLPSTMGFLEDARRIAATLGEADDVAQAITMMARAQIQAGQFERAVEFCELVDHVPCSELFRVDRDEALAHALIGLQRYAQAVEKFQLVINGFSHQPDKKMGALSRLGQAYEYLGKPAEARDAYTAALQLYEEIRMALSEQSRMGFRSNVEYAYERIILLYSDRGSHLYDPSMAFEWTERSKARTFLEMMGRSEIPLPTVPLEILPRLLDERRLVERINSTAGQGTIISNALGESLDAMAAARELDNVWKTLEAVVPEYVALRRGSVTTFRSLEARLSATSGKSVRPSVPTSS